MTESLSESMPGTWAPAQCPFRVAYSLRALDDIRLAVADAFFSVPHGGAEIGGILLGRREGLQLNIRNYAPLDCEHAFGPSFTLSPKDMARLAALIEDARRNPPDLQPVGWYHSHTRSGIFLSDADLEIHKRFFPASWHIALVAKPHAFQPTRGGFFFREADGSLRAQASYLEFVLAPLPPRSGPAPSVPPPASRVIAMPASPGAGTLASPAFRAVGNPEPPFAPPLPARPPQPPAPPVPIAPPPVALPPAPQTPPPPPPPVAEPPDPPAPDLAPPPPVAEPPAPDLAPLVEDRAPVPEPTLHFVDLDPPRRLRVPVLLGVAAGVALIAFGVGTRQSWLPGLVGLFHSAGTAPAKARAVQSLGLSLLDHGGDLIISWNHQAAAVQAATSGALEISSGGGTPMVSRLDAGQLQSGSLTFKRETEQVDVVLSVQGPQGQLGRQYLGFRGKLPAAPVEDTNPAVLRERDALAAEVERLKAEVQAQTARNRLLQKSLDQRPGGSAELDRLKSQVAALTTRTRDLEKAIKPKDEQIARLRNDLTTQQSHNSVLAKSVDDLQFRLQKMKRLSNQSADPAKP